MNKTALESQRECYTKETLKGPYKPILGDIWDNFWRHPYKSRVFNGEGWIMGIMEGK